MQKMVVLVSFAFMVSGCASTGEKITDFSDRSVVYGWLNVKDVGANRLHAVSLYQHRPQTDKPYWATNVKKFKDGYLYFVITLPNGAFTTYEAHGQSCLGILCSNTRYSYSFGRQGGDVGSVLIKAPGVYHLGSYDLKDKKTGFIEQGKFDTVLAKNPPSKREILEEILKDVEDNPVMTERIKKELKAR